jgi:hypothetical protein
VTLVIEPLNRTEFNLVNSVEEGVHFAAQINRKQIRVLADFYHMDEESEPLDTLLEHGLWLAHIHVATQDERIQALAPMITPRSSGISRRSAMEAGYRQKAPSTIRSTGAAAVWTS